MSNILSDPEELATGETPSLEEQKGVWERELVVAAITYFRVSGLEGLGSTIISGVGSD